MKHILFGVAIIINLISCKHNRQGKQEPDNKAQLTNSSTVTISREIPIWAKSIPDFELIKGTETYKDGMINNVFNPNFKLYSLATID